LWHAEEPDICIFRYFSFAVLVPPSVDVDAFMEGCAMAMASEDSSAATASAAVGVLAATLFAALAM
jgi:hypothetical protein